MANCLYCGRKTDRPKFCCNKHKDRYHNEHNPRGIYAYLKDRDDRDDDDHPFSSEGLGQWQD